MAERRSSRSEGWGFETAKALVKVEEEEKEEEVEEEDSDDDIVPFGKKKPEDTKTFSKKPLKKKRKWLMSKKEMPRMPLRYVLFPFLIMKIHEKRVERSVAGHPHYSNLCNPPPSPLRVSVFFINRWTPRALLQVMKATLMRAQ